MTKRYEFKPIQSGTFVISVVRGSATLTRTSNTVPRDSDFFSEKRKPDPPPEPVALSRKELRNHEMNNRASAASPSPLSPVSFSRNLSGGTASASPSRVSVTSSVPSVSISEASAQSIVESIQAIEERTKKMQSKMEKQHREMQAKLEEQTKKLSATLQHQIEVAKQQNETASQQAQLAKAALQVDETNREIIRIVKRSPFFHADTDSVRPGTPPLEGTVMTYTDPQHRM